MASANGMPSTSGPMPASETIHVAGFAGSADAVSVGLGVGVGVGLGDIGDALVVGDAESVPVVDEVAAQPVRAARRRTSRAARARTKTSIGSRTRLEPAPTAPPPRAPRARCLVG